MDAESLKARMEHEKAELRALYPHIDECRSALRHWIDADGSHYSLHVDIRWPQHQTIVSGPAKDDAAAAIELGFRSAAQRMHEAA